MTKMKTIKNIVLVVGALLLMTFIDYVILKSKSGDVDSTRDNILVYGAEELAKYDGSDPTKPTLLALDGLVYDVSAGREDFYKPGESYHYLVGTDSSRYLHIFGDDLIKKKYPVVGRYIK